MQQQQHQRKKRWMDPAVGIAVYELWHWKMLAWGHWRMVEGAVLPTVHKERLQYVLRPWWKLTAYGMYLTCKVTSFRVVAYFLGHNVAWVCFSEVELMQSRCRKTKLPRWGFRVMSIGPQSKCAGAFCWMQVQRKYWCAGAFCWASRGRESRKFHEGYKRIKWFMGGTDRIVDGVEINSILAEKMDEKGGDATGRRSVESEELRRMNMWTSSIAVTTPTRGDGADSRWPRRLAVDNGKSAEEDAMQRRMIKRNWSWGSRYQWNDVRDLRNMKENEEWTNGREQKRWMTVKWWTLWLSKNNQQRRKQEHAVRPKLIDCDFILWFYFVLICFFFR